MRRLALLLLFACAAFAAEEGGAAKHEVGDQLLQKWINFAILAAGIGFLVVKVGGPAFRSKKQEILDGLAEGTRRAEAAAEKPRRSTVVWPACSLRSPCCARKRTQR